MDMSAANLYRWHPAYAAGKPSNCERPTCLLLAIPFLLSLNGLLSYLTSVMPVKLFPAQPLPCRPSSGVPLARERIVALSEPKEVWYFDLGAPPDKSDVKSVDLEFTK